ncbi:MULTISPECIES: hypothetical protein [unclassified Nocardiopsis]|uniref:hypothetical protein n=1 Tax=unclassified Nocardiopsis TaxID=2649073 RepID=UPI0011611E82|nr:hypothetical protein [Nocardiopsis sp. TSRI0078]
MINFGFPYFVGMLLLSYVNPVAALAWMGVYYAALFGWAAWERYGRKKSAQQPAPSEDEGPAS